MTFNSKPDRFPAHTIADFLNASDRNNGGWSFVSRNDEEDYWSEMQVTVNGEGYLLDLFAWTTPAEVDLEEDFALETFLYESLKGDTPLDVTAENADTVRILFQNRSEQEIDFRVRVVHLLPLPGF